METKITDNIETDKVSELIYELLSKPLKLSLSLGDDVLIEYLVIKNANGEVVLQEIEKS